MEENEVENGTAADTAGSSSGTDTGGHSGSTTQGDAGTGNGGNDATGTGSGGEAGGEGQSTVDTGAAGNTQAITQLVFVDSEGNEIGTVPLTVEGGDVQMQVETVAADVPPEGWYVQTGEEVALIGAGTVVTLVIVFAIFGAVCVGTLIRSFEWKR